MPEVNRCAVLEAADQRAERREALALVWARDEGQAEAAVEFLAHAVWPYWYRFHVAEVRCLPCTDSCPLRSEAPEVLASARRERWSWVLVAPGTDLGAVASCT